MAISGTVIGDLWDSMNQRLCPNTQGPSDTEKLATQTQLTEWKSVWTVQIAVTLNLGRTVCLKCSTQVQAIELHRWQALRCTPDVHDLTAEHGSLKASLCHWWQQSTEVWQSQPGRHSRMRTGFDSTALCNMHHPSATLFLIMSLTSLRTFSVNLRHYF